MSDPLISCLMVSRGTRWPASHAIACYRRQSHANRELVIVTLSAEDEVAEVIREIGDPSIRHVVTSAASLGELRNVAVAHAQGSLIAHWDDDDLHHPDRLTRQLAAMRTYDTRACFLHRILLWWPARSSIGIAQKRAWEGTMLAERGVVPVFPALHREEDLFVVREMLKRHRCTALDWPEGYCYVIHGRNTNQAPHFEAMFRCATSVSGYRNYEAAMKGLGKIHDFAGYARTIAA